MLGPSVQLAKTREEADLISGQRMALALSPLGLTDLPEELREHSPERSPLRSPLRPPSGQRGPSTLSTRHSLTHGGEDVPDTCHRPHT